MPASDAAVFVPRSLLSLQAARAVAAILVVLFHTSTAIFALPKYWGVKPFGRVFDFGDSGVKFFFVLSGFIILHAHYKDLDRPTQISPYAWKRFRRIYPFYWLVLLLVLPIYFEVPSFGFGYETQPMVILSSILLVHVGSPDQVIIVSWTLFHEMMFYVLFAVAIWNVRIGVAILSLWVALSVVGMVAGHGSLLTDFYLSYLHFLFGFGMVAAWWVRRRRIPSPAATTLLGVAIFLLAGMDEAYWNLLTDDWRTLVFGAGSMLAVVGLVELERQARLHVPVWTSVLGDASYSIYLVHFVVLSLLAKLAVASGAYRMAPPMIAFALLAGATVLAGTLCHLAVERPMLALLGRKPAAVPGVLVSEH